METSEHARAIRGALDAIQTRRERLARGQVAGSCEPRPATTTTTASATLRDRTTGGERATASRAGNRPHAPQHEIVWITRTLVRLWPKTGRQETMGTVEFVRRATLADVRVLVDEFHPLPQRREYEFYHPGLRVPIDPSDERNLRADEYDRIIVVALPRPSKQPQAFPLVATREKQVFQPAFPFDDQPAQKKQALESTLVAVEKHKTRRRNRSPLEREASSVKELHCENQKIDSVLCELTVREFENEGTAGISVSALEGELAGVSTPLMLLPTAAVAQFIASPPHSAKSQVDSADSSVDVFKLVASPLRTQREYLTRDTMSLEVDHSNSQEICSISGQEQLNLEEDRQSSTASVDASCEPSYSDMDVTATCASFPTVEEMMLTHVGMQVEEASLPFHHGTKETDQERRCVGNAIVALTTVKLEKPVDNHTAIPSPGPCKSNNGDVSEKEDVTQVGAFLTPTSNEILSSNHVEKEVASIPSAHVAMNTAADEGSPSASDAQATPRIKATAFDPEGQHENNRDASDSPRLLEKLDLSQVARDMTKQAEDCSNEAQSTAPPTCQRYVDAFMNLLLEEIDQAFQNHALSIFSLSQLQESFTSYGIDHTIFGLNGIFLAIEDEISSWACDQWSEVARSFALYVSDYISKFSGSSTQIQIPSSRSLFLIESTLNIVADIFSWYKPTQIRLEILERDSSSIDKFSELKGKPFKLSDAEHSLLGGIYTSDCSTLDTWLADGLEALYFLYHASITAAGKDKMALDRTRQDRLRWIIQRIVNSDPSVWRKAELRISVVRDANLRLMLLERLASFSRDRKELTKLVDQAVFLPALMGFIDSKAKQATKSLSDASSTLTMSEPSSFVFDFLAKTNTALANFSLGCGKLNVFLQDLVFRVCDIRKVNDQRAVLGLSRVSASGEFSLLTHHQCVLLASDYGLRMKPRWDQSVMVPGKKNRYIFHGDDSIGIEFVYVRRKLDRSQVHEYWEDVAHFAEVEASRIFREFIEADRSRPTNSCCAIGVNALHLDLFRENVGFNSPEEVLQKLGAARSISIGYHVVRDPKSPSIRITFRIHVVNERTQPSSIARNSDSPRPTLRIMQAMNTFVCSAEESAIIAFLDQGGLIFLLQCSPYMREQRWLELPFGYHFRPKLQTDGFEVAYDQDEIAFFTCSMLSFIPRNESLVSAAHILLLQDLATGKSGSLCEKAVEASVLTFKLLCMGGTHRFENKTLTPLNRIQRRFLEQMGLPSLLECIDFFQPGDQRSILEDGLVALLCGLELCSFNGFLVHQSQWLKYFVGNEMWRRHARLTCQVLYQIHLSFFRSDFTPSDQVKCQCGCGNSTPADLTTFSAVVRLFCLLLTTEEGIAWGLQDMQGVTNCLSYLQNTVNITIDSVYDAQRKAIFAVYELGYQASKSDTGLEFVRNTRAVLFSILRQARGFKFEVDIVRIIGLCLGVVDVPLTWSMPDYYATKEILCILTECFDLCSGVTESFNKDMSNVLFRQADDKVIISDAFSLILHREHNENQRHRSIIASLVSLLDVKADSVLKQFCVVPVLVTIGVMIQGSPVIAADFDDLELIPALLQCMEAECTEQQVIVAGEVLSILCFQLMRSNSFKVDDDQFQRVTNFVAVGLDAGAQMSLPHRHMSMVDTPAELRFAGEPDRRHVIAQHASVMEWIRQNEPTSIHDVSEVLWIGHLWGDINFVKTERYTMTLRLLAVFTFGLPLVEVPSVSSDLKQITKALSEFISHRLYLADNQVLMYLFALRNILRVIGNHLAKLQVSFLLESGFLRRLLVYSRRRSSYLPELASNILWILADSLPNQNALSAQLQEQFDLHDESSGDLPGQVKRGIVVLMENIQAKLGHGQSIECDAGALAALLRDQSNGVMFFANYRFSNVTRWIDVIRNAGFLFRSDKDRPQSLLERILESSETYNHREVYAIPLTTREKEMLQLCELARICLIYLSRSDTGSLLLESSRTKASIVPLLDDKNRLILHAVLGCIVVHVTAHRDRSSELLEPRIIDRILRLCFDSAYNPTQARALLCTRMLMGDIRCLEHPFKLRGKLLQSIQPLIDCLKCTDLNVKKQAIELVVSIASKFDDSASVALFAKMLVTPENRQLLSDVFATLCQEFLGNPDAGNVLQQLVALVIQLDIVAVIDGDILVESICLAIQSRGSQAFLRPLLCTCLCNLSTQPNASIIFARKSRLLAILALLNDQLTIGEMKSIGALLNTLTTNHRGIRQYLSSHASGCITLIVRVLSGFLETSVESSEAPPRQVDEDLTSAEEDDSFGVLKARVLSPTDAEKYILKVTLGSKIFISNYTDDVYEEFMRCLLLLLQPWTDSWERYGCPCKSEAGCVQCDPCDLIAKVHGAQYLLRLLIAKRVLVASNNLGLGYFIEASGLNAPRITLAATEVLKIISSNGLCRLDMLRHASWDLWWLSCLIARSEPSALLPVGPIADVAITTLTIIGHLCAEAVVKDFLLDRRTYVLLLFSYIDPQRPVMFQRAALFIISRLVEDPRIAKDRLFQEMINPLVAQYEKYQDRVAHANLIVLVRNIFSNAPKLRQRLIDSSLVDGIVRCIDVQSNDLTSMEVGEVFCIGWEVLSLVLMEKGSGERQATQKRESVVQNAFSHPDVVKRLRQSISGVCRRIFVNIHEEEISGNKLRMHDLRLIVRRLYGDESDAKLLEMLVTIIISQIKRTAIITSYEGDNSDVIRCTEDKNPLLYPQNLQYSVISDVQNARAGADISFRGSVHLWRFIRCVWNMCARGSDASQCINQFPIEQVIGVLTSWMGSSSSSATSDTLERRQRFISFINDVLRSAPTLIERLNIHEIVPVLEEHICLSGSAGAGYELLYLLCWSSLDNTLWLASRLRGRDREQACANPTDAFRMLWSAARPAYFERVLGLNSYKTGSPQARIYLLEPSPPSSSSMSFALILLTKIVEYLPSAPALFLECHSPQMLFDLLLVESTVDTRSTAVPDQHVLAVSLLSLLKDMMELHPNLVRFFIADPRLISAVVARVFAVKIPIQLAAVELLRVLVTEPYVLRLLRRCEQWVTSMESMERWEYNTLYRNVTRLNLTPLTRNDQLKLAHVQRIPLFWGLKTAELAKLSASFIESRHLVPDALCVLVTDESQTISTIPKWMRSSTGIHSSPSILTSGSSTIESGWMYSLVESGYQNAAVNSTQRSISARCEIYCTASTTSSLIRRLCRFLVETRAELLRRVAFVKRKPESTVATELPLKSDLLGLLARTPLFASVSRDSLACLVMELGDPVRFTAPTNSSLESLPLLVLRSDVIISIGTEVQSGLCLGRGSIIGSPFWLTVRNEPDKRTFSILPSTFRVSIITPLVLQAALRPAEYQTLMKHWTEVKWSEQLNYSTSSPATDSPKTDRDGKLRDLQVSSVKLLHKLVLDPVHRQAFVDDRRALMTIIDVIESELDQSTVRSALDIILCLARSGGMENALCNNEASFRLLKPSQMVREYPELLSRWMEVLALITENSLTIRESMTRWCTGSVFESVERAFEFACKCQEPPGTAARVLEVLVQVSKEFTISQCKRFLLHLRVAKALNASCHGDTHALLKLFVQFDADPDMRFEIQKLGVDFSRVLTLVTTDLIIAIRTADVAVVATCAEFMCIVLRPRADGSRSAVVPKGTWAISGRSILQAVLKDLHRCSTLVHVLLRCVASICLSDATLAEVAAKAIVQGPSSRVRFLRLVSSAMSTLPPRSTWGQDAAHAVAIMECISSLSLLPYASDHFIRRGFLSVSVHLLKPWSSSLSKGQLQVASSILQTLSNCVKNCAVQPSSILRSYNEAIHLLLLRLRNDPLAWDPHQATRKYILGDLFRFFTCAIENCEPNNVELDAYRWLVSDIVPILLEVLANDEGSRNTYDLDVDHTQAAIRYLSALCLHEKLVFELIGHRALLFQVVKELFCGIRRFETSEDMLIMCGEIFCSLTETLDRIQTAEADEGSFRRLVLSELIELSHVSQRPRWNEYVLRTLWLLMAHSDTSELEPTNDVYVHQVLDLAKHFILQPLSDRAFINLLGLLGTVVDRCDEEAVMKVCVTLLERQRDSIVRIRETQSLSAQSFSWDFYCSRYWNQAGDIEILRLGLAHLLVHLYRYLCTIMGQRGIWVQNSSWVAAMHQFVLDDALLLLKRTHWSPLDCSVSSDAAVFIRSFVSGLRIQPETLKRAQRLCREQQLVYNAKRIVCCSSCSGSSKAQLLFALVEVVDGDVAASVAISRLPTGETNHILKALLCRLADDQEDATPELFIAGFQFLITCVEVSVKSAKLCADALREKVWRGLLRRVRAQQEKDPEVFVEFVRFCTAIWQLTPQFKDAWITGFWPLLSDSTSLAHFTSTVMSLLAILPFTLVSSCIMNTWNDHGQVFVRSLFRFIVSPVEPNVLDITGSILCNFVQAYPNLCFEVTADRSLVESLIRTFLKFHSEATEELICRLLKAETQYRSKSAVMIALCGEMSKFRSQSIESQSGLLILQPALLSAMEKCDTWHLVTEKIWRAMFVSGLSLLRSTDYNRNRRLAHGVKALIRSGRVRRIQHEASSLRELLVHWHDAGLIPSASPEISDHRDYNASSHVVAVWLQICVTLGFTVDIPRFRAIVFRSLTSDVFYAESYDSRSPTQALLNLARLQTLAGESLQLEPKNDELTLYVVVLVLCKANPGGYHQVLAYVASRLLVSPSANTALRHRLLQGESDVIDRIAWEWYTNSFDADDIAATGSLLISVAVNSDFIKRIYDRRIIDMWMFELSYSGSHESFYRSTGNQVMIRLIAIVLNHSRSDDELRDLCSRQQYAFVRYAVSSLALSSSSNPTVSSALGILYRVVQSDEVVQELWRACLLVEVKTSDVPASSARSAILASATNIMLQPNDVDRQRASYVVYQLVRSPLGSAPLFKARQPYHDTFHDLLTSALLQSIGTKMQRTLRWDISNFQRLSDVFPSMWSITQTKTAIYTLRTLHRCLRSPSFLASLWSDILLFSQLFIALATHNLEVAHAASRVLQDALVDITQEECDSAANSGAEDAIKPNRGFRQLVFFSDLRRHGLFDMIPACNVPSTFLVLTLWIEYYSHNANALEDDRTCEHLLCIQGVMLYVLQNHFSQIYDAAGAQKIDFQQHQRLCEALLRLCECSHNKLSKSPRASVKVRVRGLEILHTLCSYAVTRFSLGLFLSLKNISSLFSIVETTRDEEESTIAVQLLCDVLSVPEGKTLAVEYPVVLSRLSSWLQKRDPKLVAAAASAIKHLVVIPVGFDKNAEQAIISAVAHAFFICHYPAPDSVHNVHQLRSTRVAKCTGRVFLADKARRSEHPYVILHFVVRDSTHQSLREFQSRHILRPLISNEGFEHIIVLEEEAAFVTCETSVFLSGFDPPLRINRRKSSATCKISLTFDLNTPSASAIVDGHSHKVKVEMVQSDHILDSNALGLLGRVLAHPDSPRQVIQEVTTVVAQLSKSHATFCDDGLVRLRWHVLAVLDATWQEPHQLAPEGMDLTCLNALTQWFWQGKVSLSHFRKSAPHVLDLFRWMRSCAFIKKTLSPCPTQDNQRVKQVPALSSSCFLSSLMEWIAVMEVDMLTENCINTLFVENADVLLALCTQFYPQRSAVASFFMLAGTVVRVNRVHCEVFARKHVLKTLFELLTGAIADIRDENAASAAETLQYAARVAAKISRSDIAADKFLRHKGLAFMGLIAHSVYSCATWSTFTFPTAVAENLVLACAFLCEAQDGRSVEQFAERPSANSLSVIEMLVLFLGRSGDLSTDTPSSSIERTAATILRSLIERWPSRLEFEATLLHLVHQNDHVSRSSGAFRLAHAQFARGLQRCILLTARDFYSDLNVVRRTYSAAISVSVRTGVTPLKCRNVFASFDRDYMSQAIKNPTAEDSRTASWRAVVTNWSLPGTSARHDSLPDDGDKNVTNDAVVLEELHVALRFVLDHRLLVEALVENRKKALLRGITTANQNAKILVGIHAVLTVAFDAFVDALASSLRSSARKSDRERSSAFSTHTIIFQRWIILLEHIGGILCCGFQDLDASYYNDLFQQLHQLFTELPRFLQRMERLQSRRDSAETILNNLERLLKRITSKHELRGVTATGVGVTQDAKGYMDAFRMMKHDVTVTLATALETPDAMDRISRAVVAAEYVWRRVVGPDSLVTFMIGVKDTESLWVKIWGYLVMIGGVCRRPGSVVLATWGKFYEALGKMMTMFSDDTQKARNTSTNMLDESEIKRKDSHAVFQVSSSGRRELAEHYGVEICDVVISNVPFTGLESLLDHYGFASLGVKKAMSLLNIEELRDEVSTLMAGSLQKDLGVVQRMTPSELEQALGLLDQDTSHYLSEALGTIADSADLGIHLPLIVHRPYEVGLWQFVVQPLLRIRLHTAYQLIKTYGESNEIRRREILKAVKELAEAEALTSDNAMDPSGAALCLEDDETVGSIDQNDDRLWIKSAHPPTVAVQPIDARLGKRRVAVTALADSGASTLYSVRAEGNEVLSSDILSLVDHVSSLDPLSEKEILKSLRQSAAKRRKSRVLPPRWLPKWLGGRLSSSQRYLTIVRISSSHSNRFVRKMKVVMLFLAFWRQEDFQRDLKNDAWREAFDSYQEQNDYFLSYHLHRAFSELLRVWMPENGTLGLSLWHKRAYSVGGGLICILLSTLCTLISASLYLRNQVMTIIVYIYIGSVFILVAVSMVNITQKHFVLQERNRFRLQPIGLYYQNVLAVITILVDIVQLNSITFDPTINWNQSDQIPKLIQWLSETGVAQMRVEQVELKALLTGIVLFIWFFVLKCPNKFQESSPFLNRVVTKDLPFVLNSLLYMGFISVFFSFLSCIDCRGAYGYLFTKCDSNPDSPPFLLSHHNISCWTLSHTPYAFLGLWGVTFFLPIGILAQGMSQVLFQEEAVDIKYAPIVVLVSQLIKAMAATARAFFTFNPLALASLALAGNGVLFLLMVYMKSASLWYIKLIKSGIFAASCWSALCAIREIRTTDESSSISMNLIYLGWLGIAAVTVAAIVWRSWRREEAKVLAEKAFSDTQRNLAVTSKSLALGQTQRQFLRLAEANTERPSTRVKALHQRAASLVNGSQPMPSELEGFVRRAQAYAGTESLFLSSQSALSEATFMKNARQLARRLDQQEPVRFRGKALPHKEKDN